MATRNRSEEVLNSLAGNLTELIGGSADLTGSNLTSLKVEEKLIDSTILLKYFGFLMLIVLRRLPKGHSARALYSFWCSRARNVRNLQRNVRTRTSSAVLRHFFAVPGLCHGCRAGLRSQQIRNHLHYDPRFHRIRFVHCWLGYKWEIT